MEGTRDTFARAIDGSAGTVVFGNGINAIKGTVVAIGEDYITIKEPKEHARPIGEVIVVPLASITYYRYEQE